MRTIRVTNVANGKLVGDEISVADSSLTRLIGLMGRRNLEPGHGLLITPSSGVHTFGMRFSIDVVALDQDWQVVGLWPKLKPYRLSGISVKYKSILELPPGRAAMCGIAVGDRLLQA
jgi:uncharacterized membrane protein (UPF0127 family)